LSAYAALAGVFSRLLGLIQITFISGLLQATDFGVAIGRTAYHFHEKTRFNTSVAGDAIFYLPLLADQFIFATSCCRGVAMAR